MRDIAERFYGKVKQVDGCWEWQASVFPNGYGQFHSPRTTLAHRFSYELHKGSIPDGLVIDHLCRNRACVNPAHLEAVEQRVNLLRGETVNAAAASRTECPHGHPYSDGNTRVYRGRRICKACEAPRTARHRARQREVACP